MSHGLAVALLSVLLLIATAMLLCVSPPTALLAHAAARAPSNGSTACDRSSAGVPSTPMEAALDELRHRFPNQIVIGFEELADEQRPPCEPHIDLGPAGATLSEALARVRQADTKYRVGLSKGRLVHVYPTYRTADPPGLLDMPLPNFAVPPDDCLESAMTDGIERGRIASYTPELGDLLWQRRQEWDRKHGNQPAGIAGSILGDCYPSSRPGSPTYRNITLRQALNIMATRSLQVARGEAGSNGPYYIKVKALSWKYRFRSDPESSSGLGGAPIFQVF